MEGVRRAPAMGCRVCEGPEHFEELDDRPGPAVRHHEWEGAGLGGASVEKVNVEIVDPRCQLGPGIQPLFRRLEVVVVAPIPRQVAHEFERDIL
jgi:hypothetical protein